MIHKSQTISPSISDQNCKFAISSCKSSVSVSVTTSYSSNRLIYDPDGVQAKQPWLGFH